MEICIVWIVHMVVAFWLECAQMRHTEMILPAETYRQINRQPDMWNMPNVLQHCKWNCVALCGMLEAYVSIIDVSLPGKVSLIRLDTTLAVCSVPVCVHYTWDITCTRHGRPMDGR